MLLKKTLQPEKNPAVEIKQAEMKYKQQLDQTKLQIENSRAETEAKRVEIEMLKAQSQIDKANSDTALTNQKAMSEQMDSTIAVKELEIKEKKDFSTSSIWTNN
mgnify:CR=1 FL=1